MAEKETEEEGSPGGGPPSLQMFAWRCDQTTGGWGLEPESLPEFEEMPHAAHLT